MFIGFAGWAVVSGFVAAIMANNTQQAAELITGMWLPFLLAMLFALLLFVPLLAATGSRPSSCS